MAEPTLRVESDGPFDAALDAAIKEFQEYDRKVLNAGPGAQRFTPGEIAAAKTVLCYLHGLGPNNPRAQAAEEKKNAG